MYDIITIGGATQDVFVRTGLAKVLRLRDVETEQALLCFTYGAKINVDRVAFEVGGGAANTAVSFDNMGLKTACIAQVGEDEGGRRALATLAERGVDTALMMVSQTQSTGYSVILSSFEGERTVLTFRGANSTMQAKDLPWDALKQAGWIYISSLSGESNTILDEVAAFAHKHKIKLAFNPGATQIRRGLKGLKQILKGAEVLILNKQEAAELTAFPLNLRVVDEATCIGCGICVDVCPNNVFELINQKAVAVRPDACHRSQKCAINCPSQAITIEPWATNIDAILRELKKFGPKVVVVTDGGHGVQAYDGHFRYLLPVYPTDVVDTLGAGDAFSSAFVAGLIFSAGDVAHALKLGAANSAGCVSQTGGQNGLHTRESAEAFIRAHPEVTVRKSVFDAHGFPTRVVPDETT